jgi:penicillin-binding protein 1C
LPKEFEVKKNEVILKVAHASNETVLYWYLDDRYLGQTSDFHEFAIQPKEGVYVITVMDQFGAEVRKQIEIKS